MNIRASFRHAPDETSTPHYFRIGPVSARAYNAESNACPSPRGVGAPFRRPPGSYKLVEIYMYKKCKFGTVGRLYVHAVPAWHPPSPPLPLLFLPGPIKSACPVCDRQPRTFVSSRGGALEPLALGTATACPPQAAGRTKPHCLASAPEGGVEIRKMGDGLGERSLAALPMRRSLTVEVSTVKF